MFFDQVSPSEKVIAELLQHDKELLKRIEPDSTNLVTFSTTAVEIAREMARANGLFQKIEVATRR